MSIDPALPLGQAFARHLEAQGMSADGDASARWVRMKIGAIPFAFPNTDGRRRILRAHDLHHLLAGYDTGIVGEAEMGAWELGSGVRDRTGVRLAIRVFGFVLPRHPRRLFRAFVRGRHCRNLLGHPLDDAFLEQSVGDVRSRLGLDRPAPEPSPADRRAFVTWAAKAVAIVWGPLVPLALLIAWLWG